MDLYNHLTRLPQLGVYRHFDNSLEHSIACCAHISNVSDTPYGPVVQPSDEQYSLGRISAVTLEICLASGHTPNGGADKRPDKGARG